MAETVTAGSRPDQKSLAVVEITEPVAPGGSARDRGDNDYAIVDDPPRNPGVEEHGATTSLAVSAHAGERRCILIGRANHFGIEVRADRAAASTVALQRWVSQRRRWWRRACAARDDGDR